MKNFPVNVNGKEYWVSRSAAISISVFGKINGVDCVLANKRGKGLPNHVGEWNNVCGYIDYDETLKQACIREVFEECGVDISKSEIKFISFEDDPKRENQVITFRYFTWLNDANEQIPSNKNCEKDEVEEVKWIPIDEIDDYKWKSEKHKDIIKQTYLINFDLDY